MQKISFSCDKLISSGDFCMGMVVTVLLLNYQRYDYDLQIYDKFKSSQKVHK